LNNNDEAIIVSHMGWDGTRIVGLFSSREEAIEAVADFKLNSEKESLIFDIMRVGKLSKSCMAEQSGKARIIERHHIYKDPLKA